MSFHEINNIRTRASATLIDSVSPKRGGSPLTSPGQGASPSIPSGSSIVPSIGVSASGLTQITTLGNSSTSASSSASSNTPNTTSASTDSQTTFFPPIHTPSKAPRARHMTVTTVTEFERPESGGRNRNRTVRELESKNLLEKQNDDQKQLRSSMVVQQDIDDSIVADNTSVNSSHSSQKFPSSLSDEKSEIQNGTSRISSTVNSRKNRDGNTSLKTHQGDNEHMGDDATQETIENDESRGSITLNESQGSGETANWRVPLRATPRPPNNPTTTQRHLNTQQSPPSDLTIDTDVHNSSLNQVTEVSQQQDGHNNVQEDLPQTPTSPLVRQHSRTSTQPELSPGVSPRTKRMMMETHGSLPTVDEYAARKQKNKHKHKSVATPESPKQSKTPREYSEFNFAFHAARSLTRHERHADPTSANWWHEYDNLRQDLLDAINDLFLRQQLSRQEKQYRFSFPPHFKVDFKGNFDSYPAVFLLVADVVAKWPVVMINGQQFRHSSALRHLSIKVQWEFLQLRRSLRRFAQYCHRSAEAARYAQEEQSSSSSSSSTTTTTTTTSTSTSTSTNQSPDVILDPRDEAAMDDSGIKREVDSPASSASPSSSNSLLGRSLITKARYKSSRKSKKKKGKRKIAPLTSEDCRKLDAMSEELKTSLGQFDTTWTLFEKEMVKDTERIAHEARMPLLNAVESEAVLTAIEAFLDERVCAPEVNDSVSAMGGSVSLLASAAINNTSTSSSSSSSSSSSVSDSIPSFPTHSGFAGIGSLANRTAGANLVTQSPLVSENIESGRGGVNAVHEMDDSDLQESQIQAQPQPQPEPQSPIQVVQEPTARSSTTRDLYGSRRHTGNDISSTEPNDASPSTTSSSTTSQNSSTSARAQQYTDIPRESAIERLENEVSEVGDTYVLITSLLLEVRDARAQLLMELGELNALAETDGHGRDDFSEETLSRAEVMAESTNRYIAEMADRLLQNWMQLRFKLQEYGDVEEHRIRPRLSDHGELKGMLMRFEEAYEECQEFMEDDLKLLQMSMIGEAVDIGVEYLGEEMREMVETCDPFIFVKIPPLAVLQELKLLRRDRQQFEASTVMKEHATEMLEEFMEDFNALDDNGMDLLTKMLLDVDIDDDFKQSIAKDQQEIVQRLRDQINMRAARVHSFSPQTWNKMMRLVLQGLQADTEEQDEDDLFSTTGTNDGVYSD